MIDRAEDPKSAPFPLTCEHCGGREEGRYMKECRDEMARNRACFNCNFWLEKVRWRESGDPTAVVTKDYRHYRIGVESGTPAFRGFGGHKFTVRFHDGREVETTNLWHQGTVPERFRHRLTPNAELTS